MFKKWFKKNTESDQKLTLFAPLSGKVVALDEVPDPVFAQKMMGEGIAIEPIEGKVVSPVDGEILQVFPTKHAIGIKAENGAEILIHIGLETVALNGQGFTDHVSGGSKVKKGDILITFDLDFIKKEAKSTITPIIITNTNDMETIENIAPDTVTAGEHPLLTVVKK